MTALRVLIVDDQPLVRQGFSLVLSVETDLQVVGEAPNGRVAIEKAREGGIDVIVMDVQMPELDGIEATKVIVAEDLAKVLILTTFDRDDYVFDALDAGASGFLLKNAEPDKLVEAIRAVGYGHALLSPEVTARVIARRAAGPDNRAVPTRVRELETLTEREKDVLALVGRGHSNAEIAAELFVGESTVKTHVSNVLAKLHLRDRVQAVGFAYESGLIRVGEAGVGENPTAG